MNPKIEIIGDGKIAAKYIDWAKRRWLNRTGQWFSHTGDCLIQFLHMDNNSGLIRFIEDSSLVGFATHPRSVDTLIVQKYGVDSLFFTDDRRTYIVTGGWAFPETGNLEELSSKYIYPLVDLDNATVIFNDERASHAKTDSMYGNFYAVNPLDSTDIISWKATPTRHGKLVPRTGANITGLEGTSETAAFGSNIYKQGTIYIKAPKVNDYKMVKNGIVEEYNEYAVILGCGWKVIDNIQRLLIVAAYSSAATKTYLTSVWVSYGIPQDGELFDDTSGNGWLEKFSAPGLEVNLPWFISDDGNMIVSSMGDLLDISDIDDIKYHKYSIPTSQYNITYSLDGSTPITWTFDYKNPKGISEAGTTTALNMPIISTGTITKGRRIIESTSDIEYRKDIRGQKPNECKDGQFYLDGVLWNCGGDCPCGVESNDPKPDAKCSSIPGGEYYEVTLQGTGYISGITCSYIKYLPYKTGTWVYFNGTVWYSDGSSVSATESQISTNCLNATLISDDGNTRIYERWSYFTYTLGTYNCPDYADPTPDPYGGIRDITLLGTSSGTRFCPATSTYQPYYIESYGAYRLSCRYTYIYQCSP